MTKLLEWAVEAVRHMRAERQDVIARWMLDLAEEGAPERWMRKISPPSRKV